MKTYTYDELSPSARDDAHDRYCLDAVILDWFDKNGNDHFYHEAFNALGYKFTEAGTKI